MTELLILLAFVPFVFLAFPIFQSGRKIFDWASVAIAVAINGYSLFLKHEAPLQWIPVGAFLSMLAIEIVTTKKFRPFTVIGALFISQSLLANDPAVVLILIAFADSLFGAELFNSSRWEDKARSIQSIYRSALSLLPAAAGVLLQLQGDWLVATFAATIVFRLFSWPMTHWVFEIDKNARSFLLFAGIVPAFALWHTQPGIQGSYWSVIWLLLAAVYSIGARYFEVAMALALALFCINPVLGVAAAALWPLFVHQGRGVFLLAPITAFIGALVCDQLPKVLVPEAAYGLSALSALMIARPFVAAEVEEIKWFVEGAEVLVSGGFIAGLFYLQSFELGAFDTFAIIFSSVFMCVYVIGKIIYMKKAKWFLPARPVPQSVFSKSIISLDFLEDRPGAPVTVKTGRFQTSFFQALESEAYLVLLLGGLGAVLLWGLP